MKYPITKIPITIVAIICIAPIFVIVEGSAWIKRVMSKDRGNPAHQPPCFRCSVNGLVTLCDWCQKRAQKQRRS